MKLLKYLWHMSTWQKLPMLPYMYSTEYELKNIDRDTEHLMSLTQTRCPQGVEILKRRYQTEQASDLIEKLPSRRRKRDVGARALALIRRAYGVTPYDPMKSIARRHMKGRNRR
jgi:hypothetical protein